MADEKLTQQTELTAATADDLLYIVDTPGGTPASRKITKANLLKTILPAADSTTALQLQNAAGTTILDLDSTNSRVGIGTTAPQSLLDIQGAAGAAGTLTLATKELTVVDGDVLGKINFNAPLESDGSDSILVGASIWAEADDTFSTTVNATELVFATGASEAAAEKMRLCSDGEIALAENTCLSMDNSMSADGKYNGWVVAGTAGAALSFGHLCYLDPTDSKWELADANIAAGSDGDPRGILGICVAAVAENAATRILLWGMVRADAVFPALTINAPVYVSETAGEVVVAQPSTADVVIRVVGFGFDANTLYFCPSSDYITHT